MQNEQDESRYTENIKNENEFLKMKMMLEKGAVFGTGENKELTPEMEHAFLKNIIAFENQFETAKKIKVFDKIGQPVQFRPVAEIPKNQLDNAWEALEEFLDRHGIVLNVCSPNISNEELYRFTVEELFEYELNDIDEPGLEHHFIYDEFHPDVAYENSRAAMEDCMQYIFQKEPMKWMWQFAKDNIRLNQHTSLTEEEFKIIVNLFKQAYDNLELIELKETACIVEETVSWVKGTYTLLATIGNESCTFNGDWKVVFENYNHSGYWNINNVQIAGINF